MSLEQTIEGVLKKADIFLPYNKYEITAWRIKDDPDNIYNDILDIRLDYFFYSDPEIEEEIPTEEELIRAFESTQSMRVSDIKSKRSEDNRTGEYITLINFDIKILYTRQQVTKSIKSIECLQGMQELESSIDTTYLPKIRKLSIAYDNADGTILEKMEDGFIDSETAEKQFAIEREKYLNNLATIVQGLVEEMQDLEDCFKEHNIPLPANLDAILDTIAVFTNPDETEEYMEEIQDTMSFGARIIDHFDFMLKILEEDTDNFARNISSKSYY